MRKEEKGITLIALIITIVVMLILVAVSMNILVNSNLIGHAEKTGDAYAGAIKNEENFGNDGITVNGKDISSYIRLPEIAAGERATETSKYQTAVIPKGFTVSNATGENDISTGLVIYDIPEDEVENIKWDGTEMTQYNQFVWVPTTEEEFIRSEWTEDGRGESLENSTTYIEPFEGLAEELKTQIAQLNKSVIKYGGFYIGRYEAGSAIARSEETTDNPIPEVKRSMYPYTYIYFDEACDLSSQMYNTSNYGAKSIICTGRCFDTTLNYLLDETHRINNRYEWGIEASSREWIADINGMKTTSKGQWQDIEKGNSFNSNGWAMICSTGILNKCCSKNVFDFSGNCSEITSEFSIYSNSSVSRGKMMDSMQGGDSTGPASRTSYEYYWSTSFRPVLYID